VTISLPDSFFPLRINKKDENSSRKTSLHKIFSFKRLQKIKKCRMFAIGFGGEIPNQMHWLIISHLTEEA